MRKFQTKQFDVVLTNLSKLWVLFGGMVLLWLAILFAGHAMLINSSKLVDAVWLIVLLGGLLASWMFLEKQTAEPTRIIVRVDGFSILNLKSRIETNVQFESIVVYRFTSIFPEYDLVLKMKDGSKLSLLVNTRVHQMHGLHEFMHQFRKVLHLHQNRSSVTKVHIPVEEKALTFFEMPQGTACLVATLILLCGIAWATIVRHEHLDMTILPVCVLLGTYVLVWLAVRIRRLWARYCYQ